MKTKNSIGLYIIFSILTQFGLLFVDACALGHSTLRGATGLYYITPVLIMFLMLVFMGFMLIMSIKDKLFYSTYDEVVNAKEYWIRQNKILNEKLIILGKKEIDKLYDVEYSNPLIKDKLKPVPPPIQMIKEGVNPFIKHKIKPVDELINEKYDITTTTDEKGHKTSKYTKKTEPEVKSIFPNSKLIRAGESPYLTTATDLPGLGNQEVIISSPQIIRENKSKPSNRKKKK